MYTENRLLTTNKMGLFSKRHAADTCQPDSLRPHRMRIGNIVKGCAKVNHDTFRASLTYSSGATEGDNSTTNHEGLQNAAQRRDPLLLDTPT